jgi:antitoxin component YwqK of YwqJK toxin-antitoxin module
MIFVCIGKKTIFVETSFRQIMKKIIAIAFFVFASSFAFAQYNHVGTGANGNKVEEGQYNADPGIQAGDNKETIARKMAAVHKIGTWKYWFENGKMLAEEHYDNTGNLIGVWKAWHDNGQLSSQIDYAAHTAVLYHPNGQKMEEGKMNAQNDRTGTWTGWHENGNVNYIGAFDANGLKTGVWQYYDSNGAPYASQTFANGELVK